MSVHCSLVTGALLGKRNGILALLLCIIMFCHFPIRYLGSDVVPDLSIPDLCLLPYFYYEALGIRVVLIVRLWVSFFVKVINYLQLHWKLPNKITITITWILSKVIYNILILCKLSSII